MSENAPIIDCNVCITIMKYLHENKGPVEFRKLDGYMRTEDKTTTSYHIKHHLEPTGFISIDETGTFRKAKQVKITEKGTKALTKTLNKK